MWTQPKSEHDYALRFPDWWEADVEAMVRKDVNHPSVILYSIGNEIPEAGTPMGARRRACAGREDPLARHHAVRHGSRQRPARRRRRAVRPTAEGRSRATETARTRDDGRQHRHDPARRPAQRTDARPGRGQELGRRPPSYLDVVGYNYMETRFGTDGELYPNRVIVGQRDPPGGHRHRLGRRPPAPPRDRRLHLDRVGLSG